MTTPPATNGLRTCRTCGEEKAAESFRVHSAGRRYVHCADCMRERDRARYREKNGKDSVFDKSLRRLYGITLEQYQAMAAEQGHRCALCGEPPETAKRMHVDHDHATGRIRALLCHHCNLLLGNAKDSTVRLRQAIAYLERYGSHREGNA